MTASLAYPYDTQTDVSVDANIFIVFSKDVDATSNLNSISVTGTISGAIPYTIPTALPGRVIQILPTPLFNYTETITVSLTTAIKSAAGDLLYQNYSWTFTIAITNPLSGQEPRVIQLSRYPADLAVGVSIDLPYVEVAFTKPIQPATVTFGGSFPIAPNPGGLGITQISPSIYRLTITNSLNYATLYTINLTNAILDDPGGTALIEDGNDVWSFTTETAPAVLPALAIPANYVYVDNITDTSAKIHWVTNKPVEGGAGNSWVDYDTDTGYGSTQIEGAAGAFFTVHSVTLVGLSQKTKYYFKINAHTPIPETVSYNTGTTFITTATGGAAFNPGTTISGTLNDKSMLSVLQNTNASGVFDQTSYAIWKDAVNTYGCYYTAAAVKQWGVNGAIIDSNNISNARIFSDTHGYAIITGESGGNIYVKRIYNNAGALGFAGPAATWGSAAGDAGVNVGAGTNPSVAIVWGAQGANNVDGGFVTKVTNGTATMNIPANPFYDFGADFIGGAFVNGDTVMDPINHNGAAVTKSTNFRHVLGQSAPGIIGTGDTYVIADATTNKVTITAADHDITNANTNISIINYMSGLDLAYTAHGWTPPGGWTLGANDVIKYGAVYCLVSAVTAKTPIALGVGVNWTGTAGGPTASKLVATGAPTWTTTMLLNYFVLDATGAPPVIARISNIDDDTHLSLTVDTFTAGGETYKIYDKYCFTHSGATNQFDTFYEIQADWVGINITTGNNFDLYDYLTITGTAAAPPANALYDNTTDFTLVAAPLPVVNTDCVINTSNFTALNVAQVTTVGFAITPRAVKLATGIMADGETYQILRLITPAESASIIVNGFASALLAGKLITTNLTKFPADFTLIPTLNAGDMVYNITTNKYAVITNIDGANQLSLNKNIFAAGNRFIIFNSTMPLIETGTVTTTGNPFTDSNADFVASNVQIGDTVHNQTTNQDALVTAFTATTITLSPAIAMTVGDRYIVIQPRALVAYQDANNIYCRLIRLRDGSFYAAAVTISDHLTDNMSNPKTVTDGQGGAFIVYQDSTDGTVRAKTVDGTGAILVGGAAGTRGTNIDAGTLREVHAGPANTVYILYENAGIVTVTRRTTALAVTWTQSWAGFNSTMKVTPAGDVVVAYTTAAVNGDIHVARKSLAAGADVFAPVTIPLNGPPQIATEILTLTIASDENNGAIVSWVDDRYYFAQGYLLFTQAVDNAGAFVYNADGAGTDYNGIQIGVLNTWNSAEVNAKMLFYNNGGPPFGGLHLWYDYRETAPRRSDIYYLTNP